MSNALINFVRLYAQELHNRRHPAAPLIPVHHQGAVVAIPTALETLPTTDFHIRGWPDPARHELALITLCHNDAQLPAALRIARSYRSGQPERPPAMAAPLNTARVLLRLRSVTGHDDPIQVCIGQALTEAGLHEAAQALAKTIINEYHKLLAPPRSRRR